jgi:hypothetical protein
MHLLRSICTGLAAVATTAVLLLTGATAATASGSTPYDPAAGTFTMYLNDDHTGVIGSFNYSSDCGGGWPGLTAVVRSYHHDPAPGCRMRVTAARPGGGSVSTTLCNGYGVLSSLFHNQPVFTPEPGARPATAASRSRCVPLGFRPAARTPV